MKPANKDIKPHRSFLKIPAIVVLAISLLLSLIYTFQDRFVYFPTTPNRLPHENTIGHKNPKELNLPYEDINITTPDGVKLHGWFIKHKDPQNHPTIVFFHGRSGNIGHRLEFISKLRDRCNVNIIIVGYRGYSYSEGTATEKGLKIDSITVLDHVFSRSDIDTNKIFVLGNSMGGAVTIYAVSESSHNVRGVVLENTFTSLADILHAKSLLLEYITPFILANLWESIRNIPRIEAPILLISGQKDELIPPLQMTNLNKAAKESKFTEFIKIDDGFHDEPWAVEEAKYFGGVDSFLQRVLSQ